MNRILEKEKIINELNLEKEKRPNVSNPGKGEKEEKNK